MSGIIYFYFHIHYITSYHHFVSSKSALSSDKLFRYIVIIRLCRVYNVGLDDFTLGNII